MSKAKLVGIIIACVIVVIVVVVFAKPPLTSGMSGTYILTEAGTGGDGFMRLEVVGSQMRFHSDGTVYMAEPNSVGIGGRWRRTGNELQITLEVFGSPMVLLAQVSGSTVTFEHDGSVWRKG